MTGRRMALTDDVLRRALAELAGKPDADALLVEILGTVDTLPQVTSRSWNLLRGGRGILLVAAVLATLGIGGAIALSQPPPSPQPSPSPAAEEKNVSGFVVPFRYDVPAGETDEFSIPEGRNTTDLLVLLRGSGNMTMARLSGFVHTCAIEEVNDPSAQPARGTINLGRDPAAFLERLRRDVGVDLGPSRTTTLGNLSAIEADIPALAAECFIQLHVDNLGIGKETIEPEIRGPGKLIVARAGQETIAALIKASDAAAYQAWLPVARKYIDSFDFYAIRE